MRKYDVPIEKFEPNQKPFTGYKFKMVHHLIGLDPAATLKKDTILLADTKATSDVTQTTLFEYGDINLCQFYYNKIPLSPEIEADTPHHPRECCMVFVKEESQKSDKTKYNYVCSEPKFRCRGYLDSFMTALKYKCDVSKGTEPSGTELKPDPSV